MFLDSMFVDVDTAYQLISRIAAVALIISSLEEISLRKGFISGGVYDLHYLDAAHPGHDVRTRLPARNRSEHLALCPAVRLIAAGSLLVGPNTVVQMAVAWTIVAVTTVVIQARHRLGGEDGSDQMMTILAVTFAISLVLSSCPGVLEAGLYFIGAQAVLSYCTAGIAKLLSPEWRHGDAVCGILSTRSHGMRGPARLVQRSRPLQLLLCWATIIFESAFVLAPFLSPLPLAALLVVALAFHASIAAVMGLNGFFWAFVSTYPAIIFLNEATRAVL